MRQEPGLLYLDLMKKTLSFTLWPEPPRPIADLNYLRSPVRRFLASAISKTLEKRNLQIVQRLDVSESQRIEGRIWPGCADTMIGLKRLDNIQYCIETVLAEGVKGDLIEAGVWRGGACIFMRAVLAAYGIGDRRVFVADSFEGLPKPDVERYPADKDAFLHLHSRILAVSKEEVENNFKRYGLLDSQVVFLKGWFKDTLPQAPIERLSILRLDGDMYGSTTESMKALYPRLSSGGFCIIDDYGAPGCKAAVDDYRLEYRIEAEIDRIDSLGAYWRKE